MNKKVVKSKASTVVASLAGVAHSGESGQRDGAMLAGGEKENLIPPMLLAGLTTMATRSKKKHGLWRVLSWKWRSSVSVELEDLMIISPREPTWRG